MNKKSIEEEEMRKHEREAGRWNSQHHQAHCDYACFLTAYLTSVSSKTGEKNLDCVIHCFGPSA